MNAMQTGEFVAAFREAFGPVPELPLRKTGIEISTVFTSFAIAFFGSAS